MPLSKEIKSKEKKAYYCMLVINANSSLKFRSFVGIVSESDVPVSGSILVNAQHHKKDTTWHIPSKESSIIPHEHREYILATSAERLSHSGADYEDL